MIWLKFKGGINTALLYRHQWIADSNVDELVKQYNDMLTNILDQHAPLIMKHIRDKSEVPRYNELVLEAKQLKHRAERKHIFP